MHHAKGEFKIANIGAQGIAFSNHDFHVGDVLEVHFTLPGQGCPFDLKIKILKIDPNNICHATFINIHEQAVESIHQYMLSQQKDEIRKLRQKPT
jgi:hypothetical protein